MIRVFGVRTVFVSLVLSLTTIVFNDAFCQEAPEAPASDGGQVETPAEPTAPPAPPRAPRRPRRDRRPSRRRPAPSAAAAAPNAQPPAPPEQSPPADPLENFDLSHDTELRRNQSHIDGPSIPEVLSAFYNEGSTGQPLDFQCGGVETTFSGNYTPLSGAGGARICNPAQVSNFVCTQQNLIQGDAYQRWLYQIAVTRASVRHAPIAQNEQSTDACNIGRMCVSYFDRRTMRCLPATAAPAAAAESTPEACRLQGTTAEARCGECRNFWSQALHGFHQEAEFHHEMREELSDQYAHAGQVFNTLKQSMIASLRGTDLREDATDPNNRRLVASDCPATPAGLRCNSADPTVRAVNAEMERAISEAEFATPNNTHCIGDDENISVIRRPGGRIVVYACPRALLTMGTQGNGALAPGGLGDSRLALQLARALGHALDSCSLEHRKVTLAAGTPAAPADFNLGVFNHAFRTCLAETHMRTPRWSGVQGPATYLSNGEEMRPQEGDAIDPQRRFRLLGPTAAIAAPSGDASRLPNHCSAPPRAGEQAAGPAANQTNAFEAQSWANRAFAGWNAAQNFHQSLSARVAAVPRGNARTSPELEARQRTTAWAMNADEITSWGNFCEDFYSAQGAAAVNSCKQRAGTAANQASLKIALTFRPYCRNLGGSAATPPVLDGQEMFQNMLRDRNMRAVLGCKEDQPGNIQGNLRDAPAMFGPNASVRSQGPGMCNMAGENGFYSQGMRAVAQYHLPPAADARAANAAPEPLAAAAQSTSVSNNSGATAPVQPGSNQPARAGQERNVVARETDIDAPAAGEGRAVASTPSAPAEATPPAGEPGAAPTPEERRVAQSRLQAVQTALREQRNAADQLFLFPASTATASAGQAPVGLRRALANPACADLPVTQSCPYQYVFDYDHQPVLRVAQGSVVSSGDASGVSRCRSAQGCLCFGAVWRNIMPSCSAVQNDDLQHDSGNLVVDPPQTPESSIYTTQRIPITDRVFSIPKHPTTPASLDPTSNSRRVMGRALGVVDVPVIRTSLNIFMQKMVVIVPDYCYGRPGTAGGQVLDFGVNPTRVPADSATRRCTVRDLWTVVADGRNAPVTRPLFASGGSGVLMNDYEIDPTISTELRDRYRAARNMLMHPENYRPSTEITLPVEGR